MSVIITNVSRHGDLHGLNQYIVRINNGPVLAKFDHIRSNGLAECLRKAADAVDRETEATVIVGLGSDTPENHK